MAQPRAYEGLYTDRYASTELAPTDQSVVVVVPPLRRDHTSLLIGAGVALIVSAIVVASLVELGALGGAPGPTHANYVVPAAPPPTPTATLPPTIALTVQQLNDPNLRAHITVDSHIQLSSRVLGQSESVVVKFDGQVSGGNQSGTIQGAGITHEMRLVDGQVYSRLLPNGKWAVNAEMPAYLVICPVFGLNAAKDLQLLGQEPRDGQIVNHLQSTGWWNPDVDRVAMADLSSIPLKPDVTVLDLWTTPDGAPVAATFSGTNSATDGTKLLDIEVTYAFSQVGVAQQIVSPMASPSPTH